MQKSPPPHVCDPQNRLVVLASMPHTFLESLRRMLPFQNLFGGNTMRRSIFIATNVSSFLFSKSGTLQKYNNENHQKIRLGKAKILNGKT